MATTGDKSYYIRGGDGKVFGPVDMPTLVAWARDSRIEPSAAVSQDRESWRPAPHLAELAMEWLVETEPGTFYGPFHKDVVVQLKANGHLPANARLYRLDGAPGETPAAPKEPDPECAKLAAECARLTGELEAKASALADLESRAAKQAETTQRTMAFMESKLAERAADVESVSSELAAARDEIYRIRERAERAEARVAEVESALGRAEADLASERAGRDALEKRLSVAETEREDVRAQLESVTRLTSKAAPVVQSTALQPEVVIDDIPPRTAPRFAGKCAPAGLAALEAAAARELAAAKRQGFSIGGMFGGRK